MTRLRNCPPDFYNNCKNANSACRQCAAGLGPPGGKVYYKPVDLDQPKHPYAPSYEKAKVVRRAQQVEKDIAKEIVKGTLRSGAALGDGDHLLKGELRQEVKDRGARSSWNLTWTEYDKGRRQGIEVYAISVVCPDGKRRTMYMMEPDLFTAFLAAFGSPTISN